MSTPRAHREWSNRVGAEYRSAATTARVLHGMIQCGLPRPLLDRAQRVITDELDHAALCHACLVAIGGTPDAIELELEALTAAPSSEGPMAALVDAVFQAFCLGESFAVPLFRMMREEASHPVACQTLDRILRDEASHRAFGWDALDALMLMDPDGVRARVGARLPRDLRSFRAAYAEVQAGTPLTPEERSLGMLSAQQYKHVHQVALLQDIMPRLEKRDIPMSALTDIL